MDAMGAVMRLHDIRVPLSEFMPLGDMLRPWVDWSQTPRREPGLLTYADLYRVTETLRANYVPRGAYIVHPNTVTAARIELDTTAASDTPAFDDLRRRVEDMYALERERISRERFEEYHELQRAVPVGWMDGRD
jgi:hypothetical protein